MIVIGADGQPLDTGMGWDINKPRPTDAQLWGSSLGPVMAGLQGLAKITPDDLDPADGCGSDPDDTDKLRWALLVSRALGKPLWIDREYTYSDVLEIQEAQSIFGNGPYVPGLRMLPAAWFQNPTFSWPKLGVAAILHAPGVQTFSLFNLQIDGGQQDIDWRAVATGVHAPTFSSWLRNTPSWSGLAPHNQDGRNVPRFIRLENVHIHDTPGSCFFGLPQVAARNLIVGNAVSGRGIYRLNGECHGVTTYGFSRSSMARVNGNLLVTDWTYEGAGYQNPWPENSQTDALVTIERLPEFPRPAVIYADFDATGSMFADRWAFKTHHDCRIHARLKNLWSLADHSSPGGGTTGPYTVDADLFCENSRPPTFGNHQHANISRAHIRYENRTTNKDKSAVDWSYTGAAYQVWSKLVPEGFKVSVARQPYHAPDHDQLIVMELREGWDLPSGWPQWLVVHIPDLTITENGVTRLRTPAETIPTTIEIRGHVDNMLAAWLGPRPGVTEQYVPTQTEMDACPVRVVLNGMHCKIVSPGSFRGNHPHTIHFPIIVPLDVDHP